MIQFDYTPWKMIYGSPTNYQFGKENDLNQTSMIIIMFLIFRGAAYVSNPKQSMYGIFTYIYHKIASHVGRYTIHG